MLSLFLVTEGETNPRSGKDRPSFTDELLVLHCIVFCFSIKSIVKQQ